MDISRYYAIARPLVYHSLITVRTAMVMIMLAWITPSCISFLPIFLEWYTTEDYLRYKVTIALVGPADDSAAKVSFNRRDFCLFLLTWLV